VAAALLCAGVLVALPAGGRASVVSTCTEARLRAAVAGGGIVRFTVDCPSLVLTHAIAIPAGLDVDIRANGHDVVLDGGNQVRHFLVTGGTMSITGLTLRNGQVVGAPGVAGGGGGRGPNGNPGGIGEAGDPGGCLPRAGREVRVAERATAGAPATAPEPGPGLSGPAAPISPTTHSP
jgi:hypothetical protein